jgi:predicted phosphatase
LKLIRIKPIRIIYKDSREEEFDNIKEMCEKMKMVPKTIRKYRNTGIYYKNKFRLEY